MHCWQTGNLEWYNAAVVTPKAFKITLEGQMSSNTKAEGMVCIPVHPQFLYSDHIPMTHGRVDFLIFLVGGFSVVPVPTRTTLDLCIVILSASAVGCEL